MPDDRASGGPAFQTSVGGHLEGGGSAVVDVAELQITGETAKEVKISRNEWWLEFFEVGLVLWIAFAVSILHSIYSLFQASDHPGTSLALYPWTHHVFAWGGLVALLGYVLLRRRDFVSRVGLSTPRGTIATRRSHLIAGLLLVLCLALVSPGLYPVLSLAAQVELLHPILRHSYEWLPILSKGTSLLVLAYVLRGRGQTSAYIGLHWTAGSAVMALPLFLGYLFIEEVQEPFIFWLGLTWDGPTWQIPNIATMIYPNGIGVLAVPNEIANGFCEELIVRAWLMAGVLRLGGKAWLAILISVGVQTSYHFYQGAPLALSHVVGFTLFAIFYLRTRSILPVALAHTLVDLYLTWFYGLRQILT